ncbi:uracil-DNA glycosylase family protein [Labilibaculum manganireducens]|uniref:uracil-DNA glycosylase family protein n=1 Tax=Labilibaculum manganireducens TaxID=1940525 RepID=UPI0029F49E9D|nr:uracil-DNA glycosylase family protein [Labilibaculum manganireducens]
MGHYRIEIEIEGKKHNTLSDILPDNGSLEILFIAKTPAPSSVEIGHYFQGRQGTMFWNKLSEFDILNIPYGQFADEYLLSNNYGITDIVKIPRSYGNEPSDYEYKQGFTRILNLIEKFEPRVIVFVYKKVLDNIIRLNYGINEKSNYGFNAKLDKYFKAKVFVFPMPGTPCRREQAMQSMKELSNLMKEK